MITMRAMAITISVPASVLNANLTVFIAPVRSSANHSDTDASSEVPSPSNDPTIAPTPISVPMQSSTNSRSDDPLRPHHETRERLRPVATSRTAQAVRC